MTISGMALRRWARQSVCVLVLLAAATGVMSAAMASEYHGVVTFGGAPVPGATVTITQGGKKYVTVTDTQGFYSFPTLADGPATIDVEMTGFEAVKQDVTVAADATLAKWELKLLTLDQIRASLKPVQSAPFTEVQTKSEVTQTAAVPKPADKPAADKAAANQAAPAAPAEDRAQDGLLVNGSVNNAATSQFTLAPRFGNTASGKSLYNYQLFATIGNSALNAQPYSLTGDAVQKPQTSQITGGVALNGPIKIPGLLRNGPNLFVSYQRVETGQQVTSQGLVPTPLQTNGSSAPFAQAIYAPSTGLSAGCLSAGVTPGAEFPGNVIPAACIAVPAQTLLSLYPAPNITPTALYNYQIPTVTDTHSDSVSSFVNKTVGRKNQLSGNFGAQSSRTSYGNLFNFVDKTSGLGMNGTANWSHTFNARLRTTLTYSYSRQSNRLTPFWDNRENISGNAGIGGNDQTSPIYWGPPTLNFSSAIQDLTDGVESFSRNESNKSSALVHWNHFAHNVTGGVDFQRREFNYISQANPRGTFTFNGAATASAGVAGSGSDFADFLIGVADASAISFGEPSNGGNADKYLRETVYDFYVTDDWRVNPTLTINAGMRYDYSAPVTEIKNRLANLDVAPGFTSVKTVTAQSTTGQVTLRSYSNALMNTDRTGFGPQIGLSWRPIPGSSMVVSAGYGLRYDTSVYQGIALNMAQQYPFSSSVSLSTTSTCQLTLAVGFPGAKGFPTACVATTAPDTFGVDPNFRLGYVQAWNLIVRRDLPGSLQMTATYNGNKGTHGAQLFLPNTYAPGATNPCPTCQTGFKYLASGGDSTRESGQIQLRRRLKSGFTASATYTYSKSIDDDSSLGGSGAATLSSASIAQNWLNLKAERGLSTFDQRHLVNATVQYTTGMGKGGGTLLSGWRGVAYKEWTVSGTLTAGTGTPLTPIDGASIISGFPASVRPNLTGAPLYTSAGYVNPLAYSVPVGTFGNARRNSITGPNQVSTTADLARTFRLPDKLSLDAHVAATNPLNHPTFSSWYTNVVSSQFGQPSGPNAARSLTVTFRLRY